HGSGMRLVCPQAEIGLQMEGADAETFFLPPPPSVTSAEAAAEVVELYWQALARDVPFADYAEAPVINRASAELGRLSGFRGPVRDGSVRPDTIFRADNPGHLTGPYLSQFLWKPIPIGSTKQEQKYRTPSTGNDF